MENKLYKILNEDGLARHGIGRWSLPKGSHPGEWMPPMEGKLVLCQNGYHLCQEQDLVEWLGPAIYEAECRGDRMDDTDKIVVREARLLRKLETWNECTARLFACDCAGRVLCFYEDNYPNDERPRQAIKTARRFALGEATIVELAIASDAAWDAARGAKDAARASAAAARGAANSDAWNAAGEAAWAAVRATAWDAAMTTTSNANAYRDANIASNIAWGAASAANFTERKWQSARLMYYLEGRSNERPQRI